MFTYALILILNGTFMIEVQRPFDNERACTDAGNRFVKGDAAARFVCLPVPR